MTKKYQRGSIKKQEIFEGDKGMIKIHNFFSERSDFASLEISEPDGHWGFSMMNVDDFFLVDRKCAERAANHARKHGGYHGKAFVRRKVSDSTTAIVRAL